MRILSCIIMVKSIMVNSFVTMLYIYGRIVFCTCIFCGSFQSSFELNTNLYKTLDTLSRNTFTDEPTWEPTLNPTLSHMFEANDQTQSPSKAATEAVIIKSTHESNITLIFNLTLH